MSRIKADESLSEQALLIIEAQVDFIQRYLSDATIDLEFRHLWKVYGDFTWHKTPLIIIDSMGIDSRRKSLFAKIHGHYRTIGFADVRAISLYLLTIYVMKEKSFPCENFPTIKVVRIQDPGCMNEIFMGHIPQL